jgi:hypothetical protein
VPVVAVLVVMNFCVYRKILTTEFENRAYNLQLAYSLVYPICVMILLAVIFQPYVESAGREIFFVKNRMKIFELLIPTVILVAYMVITTNLIFANLIEEPVRFIFVNTIMIVSYCMLGYGLIFACSNIVVMLIVISLLTIGSLGQDIGVLGLLIYPQYNIHSLGQILYFTRAYIILGVVSFAVGIYCNLRYIRY